MMDLLFSAKLHFTRAESHHSNHRCISPSPLQVQADIEATSAKNTVSKVSVNHGFIRRDVPIFAPDDSRESFSALFEMAGGRRLHS